MVNKLKKLNPQFKNVLKTSSKSAKQFGYNIYLVGGVVRDLLLNRPVFDLDIAVEGDAILLVSQIAKQLNEDFRRHHSFGTATLYYNRHKIDFATARKEIYPHSGSLPKVKKSSLKEDLARRDFSINAMAISLNKKNYGQLIDYYQGRQDLKNRLIRALYPESFLDDSLRILRAVRFQQRFSFKIEAKTYAFIKQAIGAGALKWINPHRLRDELILFLDEPNPYRYIKKFYLLERFNFINKRIKLDKENFKFFIRAQAAVKFYKKLIKDKKEIKFWLIFLAGILLNLSNHEVAEVVARFGFKKDERLTIISIKKDLGKIKKLDKKLKASDIYKILNGYSQEAIIFFYAYFPRKKIRNNIIFFVKELSGQRLKIKGKDLQKIGIESSSFMGKMLKKIFYLKLDKNLNTKRQELNEARDIIKKGR
jgi:tRNA nucleotidyltransferase (CCA-adding enzyme)